MVFYEYYVDFELSKKLTSAYSFPPFGEVVLLSLKSTGEGNEVAMDKSLAICQEILDHLPKNPGPFAKKPWTICQETLGHLPRMPTNRRPSAKIAKDHLPRMPTNRQPSAKIAKDHLPRMPTNSRPSAEIAKDCH